MPKPFKNETQERAFRNWYEAQRQQLLKQGFHLNPNPDDAEHYYDYRAAFKAGAAPDKSGHWPSEFKLKGHPRMIVDGVNTKTGKKVKGKR